MTDIEILRAGYDYEKAHGGLGWESVDVGASRSDILRLKSEQMIYSNTLSAGQNSMNRYHLTAKAKKLVETMTLESDECTIPKEDVKEAMNLIIGFEDLKEEIAQKVHDRDRTHFLLIGPPACAKSLVLESVRTAVGQKHSYLAFGSRTSGAGLSEVLFIQKPAVLLMDEADKMDKDVRAILLGLMETGEIIETKSKKTRGIKLNTQVIAACNRIDKFTPEFMSRFSFKPVFPPYTRQEFIDVCIGFLSRVEKAPPDIAELIGRMVLDNDLGDVRQARGIWKMMDKTNVSEDEVYRVIKLMLKYSPDSQVNIKRKTILTAQQVLL